MVNMWDSANARNLPWLGMVFTTRKNGDDLGMVSEIWFTNMNVVNRLINLPFGDGLYNPLKHGDDLGMFLFKMMISW